jgi:hypothetical protein
MINLSKDSFSIDLKEDLYKLQKLKNFWNGYNWQVYIIKINKIYEL